MADTVGAIVGAIVNGIAWVRQKYRQFKVWVAEQLIAALDKGWKAALTIAGLVAASVIVGYVWQIMMQNAVVVAVKSFLTTVADMAKKLAAVIKIDFIMAVVNLAIIVNKKLFDQLAPLYDELGSFAQELELDFSYITTFVEVDRAILQSAYSLTNMGWLQASGEFAGGLSDWLGKLRGRMAEYAANPQQIFTDIQAEIAGARVEAANVELGRIWTAVDAAGEWIQGKGEVIITLVEDINTQIEAMPLDIQAAILPWWKDIADRVDTFERDRWDPFWKQYNEFRDAVSDVFLLWGVDIAELKRRIDDPLDWLRSLLALPEADQSTLRGSIGEFFSQFLPVGGEDTENAATAVVEALSDGDALMAAAVEKVSADLGAPELPGIPEVAAVHVKIPWYKEAL